MINTLKGRDGHETILKGREEIGMNKKIEKGRDGNDNALKRRDGIDNTGNDEVW